MIKLQKDALLQQRVRFLEDTEVLRAIGKRIKSEKDMVVRYEEINKTHKMNAIKMHIEKMLDTNGRQQKYMFG